MILFQALFIVIFILVHLFAGKLRFLDVIPRSKWLSMAGGISVAYIFVHILPELEEAQERIGQQWHISSLIEHHVYLIALAGLALFYGLERTVKLSQQHQLESLRNRKRRRVRADIHQHRVEKPKISGTTSAGVFWLHISSFTIYNALIGYLLAHREEQDLRGLLFFSIAMTLHFLVTDYGLRQDHKGAYRQWGRWALGAAVLIGWIIGLAIEISGAAIDVLFAFLAGGVILNVLKEELPEERQSRFWPFAIGAAIYTFLLLLF